MTDQLQRNVVDAVGQIKRTISMLETVCEGVFNEDSFEEREAWGLIAKQMLDGEVENLTRVVDDLS